jgi:hypothetical protein
MTLRTQNILYKRLFFILFVAWRGIPMQELCVVREVLLSILTAFLPSLFLSGEYCFVHWCYFIVVTCLRKMQIRVKQREEGKTVSYYIRISDSVIIPQFENINQ